jgi:hypothetical protein
MIIILLLIIIKKKEFCCGGVVGYYDDDLLQPIPPCEDAELTITPGNSIISARGNIKASERIHKYHESSQVEVLDGAAGQH